MGPWLPRPCMGGAIPGGDEFATSGGETGAQSPIRHYCAAITGTLTDPDTFLPGTVAVITHVPTFKPRSFGVKSAGSLT